MTRETPPYPLGENAGDAVRAASGRPFQSIDLNTAVAGDLQAADLAVSPETLRKQAAIARQAGYGQLADNLLRAAELTAVPNAELLVMYDRLRPGRATLAELEALARRLEAEFAAPRTAAFVRDAATAYRDRNLLRPE